MDGIWRIVPTIHKIALNIPGSLMILLEPGTMNNCLRDTFVGRVVILNLVLSRLFKFFSTWILKVLLPSFRKLIGVVFSFVQFKFNLLNRLVVRIALVVLLMKLD